MVGTTYHAAYNSNIGQRRRYIFPLQLWLCVRAVLEENHKSHLPPLGGTTQQSHGASPSELRFMPVAKGKTGHRRVGKESRGRGNALPEAEVACKASGEQLAARCAGWPAWAALPSGSVLNLRPQDRHTPSFFELDLWIVHLQSYFTLLPFVLPFTC